MQDKCLGARRRTKHSCSLSLWRIIDAFQPILLPKSLASLLNWGVTSELRLERTWLTLCLELTSNANLRNWTVLSGSRLDLKPAVHENDGRGRMADLYPQAGA